MTLIPRYSANDAFDRQCARQGVYSPKATYAPLNRILVTGASGFVGRALFQRLVTERDYTVIGTFRGPQSGAPSGAECVPVGDLAPDTDWRRALRGVEAVVHTAARVHIMHDRNANPLAEFRRVNTEGTLALARQAANAGVRRFVFVSSIKVNGEQTSEGAPYRAGDTPHPVDPYGVSKHEAERGLRILADQTRMAIVIVRPVLVYGPGVKGNFRTMMRWIERGVPLPLERTANRRSLLALDNLSDLLMRCLEHPAAAGQTFLASDGEDLSTSELIRRLAHAMGRRPRLFPLAPELVLMAGRLVGRGAEVARLLASLQVDIQHTRETLEWTPPVSVDQALARTVARV